MKFRIIHVDFHYLKDKSMQTNLSVNSIFSTASKQRLHVHILVTLSVGSKMKTLPTQIRLNNAEF